MIALKGKPVADGLIQAASIGAQQLQDLGVTPRLFVVRLGEDPADESYVRGLLRRSAEAGLDVQVANLSVDVPQDGLATLLRDLSRDPSVHGILLLRPLPPTLHASELYQQLAPEKDIDGMTEQNLGKVFCANPLGLAPATARAVLELLDHYGYDVAGRNVCVLGRSLVAGRPIQALLTARDATVTLCHSRTSSVARVCQRSELIVSCVGKAGFLTKEMVSPRSWVVDVGINPASGGGIVGDAEPEVAEVAEALTPVPGGLGAVTTATVVLQTIEAATRQSSQTLSS